MAHNVVARMLKKLRTLKQTTGSSNDILQLRPFSKWEGTSLKGKNLLPEGANSFLLEQFLIV